MNDLRLHGIRLLVARVSIIGFVALVLVVYLQSIASRAVQLTTLAIQHQRTLNQWGLRLDALTDYVVTLDHSMFFGCFLLATFIVWVRARDRMTTFVALLLVAYGFAVVRPADALAMVSPALHRLMDLVRGIGYVTILFFTYLFPNGRFVPRWTMFFAMVWTVWTVGYVIWNDSWLNPDLWSDAIRVPVFLLFFSTGIYAQIYRYRYVSDLAQRQQTKWIVLGLVTTLAGYTIFVGTPLVVPAVREAGPAQLTYIFLGVPLLYLSALCFPATLTTAILRYRLWDIDIVISRTLIYSTLTVLLALLYLISVIGLQQIFRSLTGQEYDLAVILSTLVIAALFNPLRRRIQDNIDRRFNRHKYNAQQVLARFSATVRERIELDQLTSELLNVVNETMQPTSTRVWLKPIDKRSLSQSQEEKHNARDSNRP